MPQIKEYRQQVAAEGQVAGRRATADDFGGGDGMLSMGRALQGSSDLLREQEEREDVSNTRVMMAKARADWTLHLKERSDKAKPGDITFADSFNKDFTNYLSEAKQGVKTKAGLRVFEEMGAELGGHFSEKAGLFQAHSVGVKAKQDYDVELNSFRNVLINDPTQFESVLRQAQTGLDDPSSPYARLPEQVKAELGITTKKELGLSAVQGVINMNPELAVKQLTNGRWDEYVDADKKQQLINAAEQGIRANRIEEEWRKKQLEEEKRKQQQATQDGFLEKFAAGKLTTKEILSSNLDPFGSGSKEQFMQMLKTRATQGDQIKTDPGTMIALYDRVHLPDGDPRKIRNEEDLTQFFGRGLSFEDLTRLRKEVRDARTPEGERLSVVKNNFFQGMKGQITKSTLGKLDEKGDEQFFRFQHYVEEHVALYKKENKDPSVLFDPNSKEYIGKAISMFARDINTVIKDKADGIRRAPGVANPDGSIPPDIQRLPGETLQQWKARTGR